MSDEFKIVSTGTHSDHVPSGTIVETSTPESSQSSAEPAKGGEENKETAAQAATETKAEPASQSSNTAPLASTKKPAETQTSSQAEVPKQTASQPAEPSIDWSKIPLEQVLKAKGLDDQFINLATVYSKTGKLDRYVEAMSKDFSKMSPEQLMRYDLERQYPQANPEQLELLYDEVRDKYKLNPDLYDPESREAKAAKVRLDMDAQALSKKYSDEMAQHKLPSFDPLEQFKQQQQQSEAAAAAEVKSYLESDIAKSLLKDKKVVLKDLSYKDSSGKEVKIPDFNFLLDNPQEILDIVTGSEEPYVTDENGKLHYENLSLDAAFKSNRKGFVTALINYGKMLGVEEKVEQSFNTPKPNGQIASPVQESLNEAFVNRGKHGKSGG